MIVVGPCRALEIGLVFWFLQIICLVWRSRLCQARDYAAHTDQNLRDYYLYGGKLKLKADAETWSSRD